MDLLPVLAQTTPTRTPDQATHAFGNSKPIANRYIVVFTADVANPAQEAASLLRGANATLHHTFSNAIKGFAATIPAAALPALQNNPRVDYIEQDQSVSLTQATSPQSQATWGLDRIDQASLPLDSRYNFNQVGQGVGARAVRRHGATADGGQGHLPPAGGAVPASSTVRPTRNGAGAPGPGGWLPVTMSTLRIGTWGRGFAQLLRKSRIGRSPAVSRAIWNGTVFSDLPLMSMMSYCDTR